MSHAVRLGDIGAGLYLFFSRDLWILHVNVSGIKVKTRSH